RCGRWSAWGAMRKRLHMMMRMRCLVWRIRIDELRGASGWGWVSGTGWASFWATPVIRNGDASSGPPPVPQRIGSPEQRYGSEQVEARRYGGFVLRNGRPTWPKNIIPPDTRHRPCALAGRIDRYCRVIKGDLRFPLGQRAEGAASQMVRASRLDRRTWPGL